LNLKGLGWGENKLETIISYWLLTGVVISLVLEVIGMIFYYSAYGNFNILTANLSWFVHGQNFFTFLINLFQADNFNNKAVFFLTFGMTTLILTPYIMVIIAFIYFLWQRNFKYMLITAVVVTIISVSLSWH
jgi:uncharacterized membrane protein